MKKDLLIGASLGLSFAGVASIITRFNGFSPGTLTVLLYLYVLLGILNPLKDRVLESSPVSDFLHRIVIVFEGEEMELKKVITGEKYRVKGDVEKV